MDRGKIVANHARVIARGKGKGAAGEVAGRGFVKQGGIMRVRVRMQEESERAGEDGPRQGTPKILSGTEHRLGQQVLVSCQHVLQGVHRGRQQ